MQLSSSESVIDTIHGYHLQIVITVNECRQGVYILRVKIGLSIRHLESTV